MKQLDAPNALLRPFLRLFRPDGETESFDFLPRRTVTMSPEEYLNMPPESRADVRDARFVPPRIGGGDFGRFEITLNTPEYFSHDTAR